MKLNPPNAHRSQIIIYKKRQTRNVQFRFMPNAIRILKPIQKSSKCVRVFRNTGANAVTKNQTRLAYEDKRDLYCILLFKYSISPKLVRNLNSMFSKPKAHVFMDGKLAWHWDTISYFNWNTTRL